jgi:condensin complex subunit 1
MLIANQEEDDMRLVGAEADDVVAELSEKEILFGSTPLILTIFSNPTKYPDIDLGASASLALSKFMLVSSDFCDTHPQFRESHIISHQGQPDSFLGGSIL